MLSEIDRRRGDYFAAAMASTAQSSQVAYVANSRENRLRLGATIT
jgi:hypothetical protein